ncbi:MAG: DUF4239 domain-containing protein [Luteolibacter sp.]|uniref:bestrophin-like domain n=1 Tax=Luteolibacter sp. TaxID=1962973 RepID=UPI003266E0E8
MIDSFFDLPLAISGPLIVITLCAYSVAGLFIVRRWILPRLAVKEVDGEFSGAMLQAVMVFYGLAVALMSVSVWETYGEVSKTISQEATSLASLYRDVSSYPDPIRPHLQEDLRIYVDQVIHQAWPQQRRGEIPEGGVKLIDDFQKTLASFEPITEGQKILHAEAMRAYNIMIQARRMRLDSVETRLPGILWFVIVSGAFISLCSAFFFRIQDVRLHGIQVILLSTFIGLVIFMIFALDRPYRGDLGLSPEPYQLIYDQLMKPQ